MVKDSIYRDNYYPLIFLTNIFFKNGLFHMEEWNISIIGCGLKNNNNTVFSLYFSLKECLIKIKQDIILTKDAPCTISKSALYINNFIRALEFSSLERVHFYDFCWWQKEIKTVNYSKGQSWLHHMGPIEYKTHMTREGKFYLFEE